MINPNYTLSELTNQVNNFIDSLEQQNFFQRITTSYRDSKLHVLYNVQQLINMRNNNQASRDYIHQQLDQLYQSLNIHTNKDLAYTLTNNCGEFSKLLQACHAALAYNKLLNQLNINFIIESQPNIVSAESVKNPFKNLSQQLQQSQQSLATLYQQHNQNLRQIYAEQNNHPHFVSQIMDINRNENLSQLQQERSQTRQFYNDVYANSPYTHQNIPANSQNLRQGSKSQSQQEIGKNVRLLGQAYRGNNGPGFFKLPKEVRTYIAGLTADPKVHNQDESDQLAHDMPERPVIH